MNNIESALMMCDQIRTPSGISGGIRDGISEAIAQRDAAIEMLAKWCIVVDRNGSDWDNWADHYMDVMYRPTRNPAIRELLDLAIAKAKDDATRK